MNIAIHMHELEELESKKKYLNYELNNAIKNGDLASISLYHYMIGEACEIEEQLTQIVNYQSSLN